MSVENPLKRFEPLIGRWELKGRTMNSEVDNITGWTTFEWMPGGFFIKAEGEMNFKGFVMQNTEIIAYDTARKTFLSNVYASVNGTILKYEWDLQGHTLTHWCDGSYYTGTISEDGCTITGDWKPDEDATATDENTYDTVMIRVK